jgi:DNA adenine methylase
VAQDTTLFPLLHREVQCSLLFFFYCNGAHGVQHQPTTDPVKNAWAFWYLAHTSYLHCFAKSFPPGGHGHWTALTLAGKRDEFTDQICHRLRTVHIENIDAIACVNHYDSPDTFFYVDPPYYNSDCRAYDGYSESDYTNLLSTLARIQGSFLLSSYPSVPLTTAINRHSWHHRHISMPLGASGQATRRKIECLTFNYTPKQLDNNLFSNLYHAENDS